ncbi:MAG: hypothetical protein U0Z75_09615 [Deinococcaceae bacterium]
MPVRQSELLWLEVIFEVAPKLVHVPRDALKNASNVGFDEVLALLDRTPQVPWKAPGWFFEISLWWLNFYLIAAHTGCRKLWLPILSESGW